MEESLKEYNDIVNEVCEKYNYDSELKTVLLKAIPAMLEGSSKESKELFYQMLKHTPIVITENLTQEGYKSLEKQYLGDINPHIVDIESASDEYFKRLGAGAYVSECVLDENLQVQGKKSFIYIQKVGGKAKEFFGTDINVAHLLHELGHAWHSEQNEYNMQNGFLMQRTGTANLFYSFSPKGDGKFIKKHEGTSGLMIEEGLNTLAEEKAMASYMGISLEEMRKKYKDPLVRSVYQGYISGIMEQILQKLPKEIFEKWRCGDLQSKAQLNELLEGTECWQNDIWGETNKSIKKVVDKMESPKLKNFFKKHENIFFPDMSGKGALAFIDNLLNIYYDISVPSENGFIPKYNMGLDNYREFLSCLTCGIGKIVKQARDKLKEFEGNSVKNEER